MSSCVTTHATPALVKHCNMVYTFYIPNKPPTKSAIIFIHTPFIVSYEWLNLLCTKIILFFKFARDCLGEVDSFWRRVELHHQRSYAVASSLGRLPDTLSPWTWIQGNLSAWLWFRWERKQTARLSGYSSDHATSFDNRNVTLDLVSLGVSHVYQQKKRKQILFWTKARSSPMEVSSYTPRVFTTWSIWTRKRCTTQAQSVAEQNRTIVSFGWREKPQICDGWGHTVSGQAHTNFWPQISLILFSFNLKCHQLGLHASEILWLYSRILAKQHNKIHAIGWSPNSQLEPARSYCHAVQTSSRGNCEAGNTLPAT